MNPNIETNLDTICNNATAKQIENDNFINTLKSIDSSIVDELVFELNETISAQIDCTTCGNCCKTLMINVEESELLQAATHLNISVNDFEEKYIEKSLGGRMLINQIPCAFLNENKCTIYESRFAGCIEFPALHLPHITKRLFTLFMHYGRCPIIYNVVEQLKVRVKNM